MLAYKVPRTYMNKKLVFFQNRVYFELDDLQNITNTEEIMQIRNTAGVLPKLLETLIGHVATQQKPGFNKPHHPQHAKAVVAVMSLLLAVCRALGLKTLSPTTAHNNISLSGWSLVLNQIMRRIAEDAAQKNGVPAVRPEQLSESLCKDIATQLGIPTVENDLYTGSNRIRIGLSKQITKGLLGE